LNLFSHKKCDYIEDEKGALRLMKKLMPIILIAALIAIGCAPKNTVRSGSVDPANIYQSYDVSATWHGTTVVVMLRDGGPEAKVIELGGNAQVEYNGGVLRKDRRVYSDTAAYVSYGQEDVTENSFVFTDPAGKKYRNSLTMEPVEIDSEERFTADRNKDLVLRLSRPIKADETLTTTVYVTPTDKSPNASRKKSLIKLENNYFEGRSTIIIKQIELLSLSSGQASVSVKISGEKKIEEAAPAGGKMTYDFETKGIYFTLPD
jgi:hypothetical protein